MRMLLNLTWVFLSFGSPCFADVFASSDEVFSEQVTRGNAHEEEQTKETHPSISSEKQAASPDLSQTDDEKDPGNTKHSR